jgi:hypothetical protein
MDVLMKKTEGRKSRDTAPLKEELLYLKPTTTKSPSDRDYGFKKLTFL